MNQHFLLGVCLILFGTSILSQAQTSGEESLRRVVLQLSPENNNNHQNSEGDFITLKNGRILFIYSHFIKDLSPNQSVYYQGYLAGRFSDDSGKTWSNDDFIVVENDAKIHLYGCSLLRLQNGNIAIFYLRKNSYQDCLPIMRISTDEANTWSSPKTCITDQKGYYVLNNGRVIQLKNGRILMAVALHATPEGEKFNQKAKLFSYYSDDNGLTWNRSSEVQNPSDVISQEPGVIELKDGTIMMFCRTDRDFQYLSWSKDKGQTWSPLVASNLPSPLSPASIARIPSTGDLLVVWNNNDGSNPQIKGKRTPLTVAVSKNEGKNWQHITDIETDPNGWYCYTSIHFTKKDVLLAYCSGSNHLKESSISLIRQKDLYKNRQKKSLSTNK